MPNLAQKILDNAIVSIGAAFVAGILTTSLAALFSGAFLPLWRMYPAEFRSESVMWLLIGVVGGIVAGWLYASQRSLSAGISIGSWVILLLALVLFAINQDNRDFFFSPQIEYGVFCAILTMFCMLSCKTALHWVASIKACKAAG
ncbi:hypothetical protein [Phaeobacter gallaeciensis]|uniref:hypothetical protein n=1 Tax=Phaeobacter gallaeciensis TaxID=60890 RepID=UPI00237F9573|nr:hypothetical protein [Phaeobacter gallaeciensis]MDE4100298.1 hypothetical protein [Phaeobacter gallaeciensis]MDE4109102.1 hypothetical protein [Phaeobacter gallaeciensis]MDE4113569.1 hypothetical protein [Phaeobacter gallaeciensis]MDE4118037.1 hypothetical protein [Phaeobacter gallaeciensis]MDE4122518.1 hypothetical protein [Phaeobacter gallaeciensis]